MATFTGVVLGFEKNRGIDFFAKIEEQQEACIYHANWLFCQGTSSEGWGTE